ncbi:MAG: PLDc N-terminal domain-containing protein [Anaerolineales bacterium]
MDNSTHLAFFLIQIVNFGIVIACVFLDVIAVTRLRQAKIESFQKILWFSLILFVPYLGAIIYLTTYSKPTHE